MKPGQVSYTHWSTGGKVIDDGTVSRLDETSYRWTAAEPNHALDPHNSMGCRSRRGHLRPAGALALPGPDQPRHLESCVEGADIARLKYFRVTPRRLRGVRWRSRATDTRAPRYEIWVPGRRGGGLLTR